ncbi:MAG: sigma-70 family RNA polymerase sigma factor [Anaerolineales bacterium]|jgi:RNA polymerase sigma-70 factor (ECF subfamily)
MDEDALINEAKRGDLDSFNRLVLAYEGIAYHVAFRIMGEKQSAEDATQDAFISAYKSLKSFRGGSFRSWLLRIVTNACYDELRKRKRRPASSLDHLSDAGIGFDSEESSGLFSQQQRPEQEVEQDELRKALERCLELLPGEYKIVAVLVDVQGFDYREASEVIQKPLGTVKSRLARARSRMRDCLQDARELLPGKYRLEDETR